MTNNSKVADNKESKIIRWILFDLIADIKFRLRTLQVLRSLKMLNKFVNKINLIFKQKVHYSA